MSSTPVSRRYFALLRERSIDRREFQRRLHADGRVSGESCTEWEHSDFSAAIDELERVHPIEPRVQWNRELDELAKWLRLAAERTSPGWSHVEFERLRIGMRILEGGRHELMVYKPGRLTTPEADAAWTADLLRIARQFGALGWRKENGLTDDGWPKATFTETPRQSGSFNREEAS